MIEDFLNLKKDGSSKIISHVQIMKIWRNLHEVRKQHADKKYSYWSPLNANSSQSKILFRETTIGSGALYPEAHRSDSGRKKKDFAWMQNIRMKDLPLHREWADACGDVSPEFLVLYNRRDRFAAAKPDNYLYPKWLGNIPWCRYLTTLDKELRKLTNKDPEYASGETIASRVFAAMEYDLGFDRRYGILSKIVTHFMNLPSKLSHYHAFIQVQVMTDLGMIAVNAARPVFADFVNLVSDWQLGPKGNGSGVLTGVFSPEALKRIAAEKETG